MTAHPWADIASDCGRLVDGIESTRARLVLDPQTGADDIRAMLGAPPDLVVQPVRGGELLLYLETITDGARLDQVVRRLGSEDPGAGGPQGGLGTHYGTVVTAHQAAMSLLSGSAVLIRPGAAHAVAMDVGAWPKRTVSEPNAEVVLQGPHDGFIEDLRTNVALVRHRIPEPTLRWDFLRVGRRAHADGACMYLAGVVRPELLARVRRQLRRVRPSFITDTTMLGQAMALRTGFLFPTVGQTERPDVAAAALLEGRVVVMTEGSPMALLLPNVLAHLLHSPQDYYNRPFSAVLHRLLRLVGSMVALTASPVFVALVGINRELVPTPMFISIAQARSGVPLGVLPEIMVLEVMVEVIREAGLHLPGKLGQTISIVGAVVIGQSAVMAGLISAPAIVVVSIAFICSFVVPSADANLALRVLRYPLILLAAAFGVFGIAWGLALILAYLCALHSCGVPYLAPISPLRPRGLQDAIWRRPLPQLRRSFIARRRRGGGR